MTAQLHICVLMIPLVCKLVPINTILTEVEFVA